MKAIIFLFLLFSLYSANPICPAGFKLVNQNKCLKVYPNSLKHLEAEATCRGYGGTLVNIKNAIDNRAVVNLAANAGASYIWIGVFCFGNNTCYQDDGTLSYSNFASGFSNNACVYMSTSGKTPGQWLTGPCQVTSLPFVCEVPTTLEDPTCLHNYNGFCYLPSHELPQDPLPSTTFSEAIVLCQEYGAKLASVHSQPEIDFIRGIYKGANFSRVFLGGKQFINHIDWVDDTQWDYDYSDPLDNSTESCLQMDTSSRENNGMWSRVDCKAENYFLCKRDLRPEVSMFKTSENSPLYLAPGKITSSTPGTWNLAAFGPYRLGLYFTKFSSDLEIYDEYGNLLNQGTSVLAPTNTATITLKPGGQGFSLSFLPF
uniref:C-type LECtin n=1 Tax=Caenorhabditis tropicalis TaxID=1561998 RepID=A0A1I7UGL1_9PELO